MDATQRFSNRVENYIRYRPGYPREVIDLLVTRCDLNRGAVVADVGSGTGLLSQLFLQGGNRVYGIEPNREMREAGQGLLWSYSHFVSVDGRAEATGLPTASVDFVVAGQAFHWFDPKRTVKEFRRVLRDRGWIVLIWNDRQRDSPPFMRAYEQLLRTYGVDYSLVDHRRFGVEELQRLLGSELGHAAFENRQRFDYTGLKGRLLSSSYAPRAGEVGHDAMIEALYTIFDRFQVDGAVDFLYTTDVYYCQV